MGKVTDLDLTERFSWQHVLNMFLALCDDAADLSFDNRMLAGRRMLTLEMRLDAPAELTLPTVTEKNGALIETWANGTVVLGGTEVTVESEGPVWRLAADGAAAVNYRAFKDMVRVMTDFGIPCEFAWSSYPVAPLCDDAALLHEREQAACTLGAVHTFWARGTDEAVKAALASLPASGEVRVQNMTTANTWITGAVDSEALAEKFGF